MASTVAKADARNRAWRTFVQNGAIDLGVALVLAVGPALAADDFTWTGAQWKVIGLLAGKTAVATAVSYVSRLKVAPPGSVS